MKVVIVGGGPAGLYTALLLKKDDPAQEITVLERNRADDTFGWGVVFSDQTLENFRAADEPTYRAITENFAHWDDIDVVVRGRRITSGGHGFSGIGRHKLLDILQRRAAELGVDLRFSTEVRDTAGLKQLGLGDADVIVAADGVNSVFRAEYAATFEPDLDVRTARFIWLGTTLPFDAFTFFFVENEAGVFQAHCYRFDTTTSTFIVECDEASWRAAGFGRMDSAATIAACEKMFAELLQGHRLVTNDTRPGSPWMTFTAFFILRRHKNVWFDLSGIPPKSLLEYFPRLAELEHKLLWGTDWPSPGITRMRKNVDQFLALQLSESVKRAALETNPERLLPARA